MPDARVSLLLVSGLFVLALAGCQNQDEIRRYQVPRVEVPTVRLLGAMIPRGDNAWFFKVLGPATAVEEHKDRFDRFMRSVKFTGKSETPPTWTLPEGWREEPKGSNKSQMPGMERYATFRLPSKEHDLVLTVVLLKQQGKAGSVLENVNRWRRDSVGLPEVDDEELGKVTTELKIGDSVATMVDMTGPGARASGMPMARPIERPVAPAQAEPLVPDFKVPDGWRKVDLVQFSVATFRTGEGEKAAVVTVSSIGGGLLLNVNRWRTIQLGLQAVSAEELAKDLRTLDVAGTMAPYVELIGPQKDGPRKAILGVVTEYEGTPWVFKMSGAADVVAGQKSNFETFVRSVRFAQAKEQVP